MYDVREAARVRRPLLFASALAWAVLLAGPSGLQTATHAPANHVHAGVMFAPAAGWVLMLAAMMSPVLIHPLHHVRTRSLTHRRVRAMVLFVAAYAAIWIAPGGVLLAVSQALTEAAPDSPMPAMSGLLVALLWQCSPVKQRCLNRCRVHPPLAAFGAAADLDTLRFGATHGLWCAGSCWAMMLAPMLMPHGHLVAMAVATLIVFSERLEQARPPRWRLRGLGKAVRIVVAQTRMRLPAVVSAPQPW
jgi:predicted metal-binding membrane protein